MKKTNFILLVLGFSLVFAVFSCKEEENPKAVVRVVETIDSVLVPVAKAFVQVGPATKETVLEDVLAEGYTNSSGYIEFEFSKELVLKAVAIKPKLDDAGNIIFKEDGKTPQKLKEGYKTLVLKEEYTDNKTIEVK